VTVAPRRRDIILRGNRDFSIGFAFPEPGGRVVDDLVLTDGSTSATSETAAFTEAEDEKVIAVLDGVGIPDTPVTMTYVSATEVTLSEPATADRVGAPALIRAVDCSSFRFIGAQVKKRHGKDVPAIVEFTPDDSRASVGLFVLSIAQSVLESNEAQLAHEARYWDWPLSTPAGDIVPYAGVVTYEAGVTHP